MSRLIGLVPDQVASRIRFGTGFLAQLAQVNSPITPTDSGEFDRTQPQERNVSQLPGQITPKHVHTHTASATNLGSGIKGTT